MFKEDLVGKQVGLLTIIASTYKNDIRKRKHWLCRCICGREVVRRTDILKASETPSCCKCKEGKQIRVLSRGQFVCPKGRCVAITPTKQKFQACKQHQRDYVRQQSKTINSRWNRLRRRAKQSGISFSISFADYKRLIAQECDYCDGLMGTPVSTGGGLDRLDNSRGYEIDNVVPCCTDCNYLRQDILTPDETKVAVKAIVKYRKQHMKKAGLK